MKGEKLVHEQKERVKREEQSRRAGSTEAQLTVLSCLVLLIYCCHLSTFLAQLV